MAICDQKKIFFFPAVLFSILVIRTLDPGPDSLDMPDPNSINPDPQH
jgi:hypothetical protein